MKKIVLVIMTDFQKHKHFGGLRVNSLLFLCVFTHATKKCRKVKVIVFCCQKEVSVVKCFDTSGEFICIKIVHFSYIGTCVETYYLIFVCCIKKLTNSHCLVNYHLNMLENLLSL